ncbi:C2 domain protein [Cooperia oncophora]
MTMFELTPSRCQGLAGQLKPDLEMMAICKVSIPGLKSGKEQTSEVKRGRDPIFNQEFFFDHVTIEDLDTKNISIQAFHHEGAKLGKDLMIGEAMVPLRDIRELNAKKEVKIIEEIKQTVPKSLTNQLYRR